MNDHNQESKLEVRPDEKDLLIEHVYDGIQELNHPLPSWWNLILYISIIFSVGYFAYYQFFGGASLEQEFEKEYSEILAAQQEFKRQNELFKEEHYKAVVADDGVNKGKAVFELNCLPCHAENGKGDVGPNLTDAHWMIAKGTPETIYSVVFSGSEENGMPAWAELLPKDEIYQAVAYVMSLKNTYQKGGKAPQGEKIE